MPMVRIECFPGRSAEQKRRTAGAVTAAVVQHLICAPDHVQVVFVEVAKDDWAVGGRLASDPPPGGTPR